MNALVKPRYRGPAYTADGANRSWAETMITGRDVAWRTADSFQNFAASIGVGTQNQNSASGYGFNFITRNRSLLEAAYRGSWVVGAAVDIPADDMTCAGLELTGLDEDDATTMNAAIRDMGLSQQIGNGERWSRLFGGAINFMMIDGQDPEQPLNLDSVGLGQFKGLQTFDRTVINPALNPTDLVTEMGPNIGLPAHYQTFNDGAELTSLQMHHSRCLRHIGIEMPYYQRRMEIYWGASVIERIWDRLVGFDSTTQGIVQLVYKAHLRVMKVKQLRNNIAAGGAMATATAKMFDFMRQTQTAEGLTLIDGEDEFEVYQYAFSGLDKVLEGMGGQLCGALDIPYSRMFGQTPGGLAATGDGDMQNYDKANSRKQETRLRRPWTVVLDVLHRSVLGRSAAPDFGFKFNPLYIPTAKEKADEGKTVAEAVVSTFSGGIITQQTALRELRSSAETTGLFASITDEEIDAAEDTVPTPEELASLSALGGPDLSGEQSDDKGDDLTGDIRLIGDSSFEENKHPRDDHGQFGSGGSSTSGPSAGSKIPFVKALFDDHKSIAKIKTHLESVPIEKLNLAASLLEKHMGSDDPQAKQVKKAIEVELEDRGSRGTRWGHGEKRTR